jgi:O-acetyl-ADP-ribose deacetylase (regulator of RNase III)
MTLQIKVVSILKNQADIIVISAHPSLLAGSGISGIIHKAAGPELEQYAKPLGPLKPGQAVITPAFNLNAKYIIHTICPRYMDGQRGEAEQLASAYSSALAFYNQVPDAKSISFVSMGTGVYKWPLALAADIAIRELLKSEFEETFLCVMDENTKVAYQSARERLSVN